MKLRKLICLLCIFALMFTMFVGCNDSKAGGTAEDDTKVEVSDERKETLFITGLWWGAPNNFNHLSGWSAFPCNIDSNTLVYEVPFMYNINTDELEPLLAESYKWLDEYTVEVKMRNNAHFHDGEAVTAEDVVYTLELGQKYASAVWSGMWDELDKVELVDEFTFTMTLDENKNKIAMREMLCKLPVHPKHVWEVIEEENDYDPSAIAGLFNENPVGSGPYKVHKYDDTRITVIRDDNYWGKSVFGKLPAPKYITHLDFSSNDAASIALEDGDLDYSENFIPNVWTFDGFGETIKTFLNDEPYYKGDTIPTIYLNVQRPGLDNKDVRKALAHAINYPKIVEMAMSKYSEIVEPGLFANIDGEKNMVDRDALKELQWEFDEDKANEILDSIGAVKGDDGIRVLPDGTRLGPWKVMCPAGWTEWNASLEIVAQSAKKVGIEIETHFPEWSVYNNGMTNGDFDIVMNTPAAYCTPAKMWKQAHDLMMYKGVPEIGEMAFWNYGRYHNERADEILELIPQLEDQSEIKALYTELNEIYLTDVPTIPLMYRPMYFYTVNESVWKGFPREGSDLPAFLFDGAGIKGLYELTND